jgi:hypothetical protein
MFNQKGVTTMVLVAIIAVVVVGGGIAWYFVAQNSNENTNTVVSNTNVEILENTNIDVMENTNTAKSENTNTTVINENTNTTTTDDEISDLETYTNELAGFSLEYPSNWTTQGFVDSVQGLTNQSDVIYLHGEIDDDTYVCVNIRINEEDTYSISYATEINELENGLKIYQAQRESSGVDYVRSWLSKNEVSQFTTSNGSSVNIQSVFNCTGGDLSELSLSYQEQIDHTRYDEAMAILASFQVVE